MHARGLQFIKIGANRAVLKRGTQELLVEGPTVGSIVEPLVQLLDGTRTRDQILDAFPGPQRAEVEQLLATLGRRRLIAEGAEPEWEEPDAGSLQRSFFWNFGAAAVEAPARLRDAKVLIVGRNLVARSLVRSLLEMGVGRVLLARHPILDDQFVPFGAVEDARFELLEAVPPDEAVQGMSLVCAASDFGEAEALLELNRVALSLNRPYLPVWLSEMIGYVGPLNYPFETACMRCFRLRADSNDSNHDVSRAVRRHSTSDPEARRAAGFLPPMPAVLGEIAAMEIAKAIGQFVPSDTVGRHIEVNLVSFGSTVRRVLKIPRCPDCSDVMVRGPMVLTRGPQIPQEA